MAEQKFKLQGRITDFESVSRALNEIEKTLNSLMTKTTQEAESATTLGFEGETGETRVIHNTDKSYSFSIMTKDGWKTPVWKDSEITFKDKPKKEKIIKDTIEQIEARDTLVGNNEAENTIYDEGSGKFSVKHLTGTQIGGLPRPDYTSAWIDVQTSTSNGGTLTHNLGVIPTLGQVQVCRDAYYNGGDPTEVIFYPVTSRMPKNTWHGYDVGPMMHFTKTTVGWWLHDNGGIFQNYGSITQADSMTVEETGYFRLLLWK